MRVLNKLEIEEIHGGGGNCWVQNSTHNVMTGDWALSVASCCALCYTETYGTGFFIYISLAEGAQVSFWCNSKSGCLAGTGEVLKDRKF